MKIHKIVRVRADLGMKWISWPSSPLKTTQKLVTTACLHSARKNLIVTDTADAFAKQVPKIVNQEPSSNAYKIAVHLVFRCGNCARKTMEEGE